MQGKEFINILELLKLNIYEARISEFQNGFKPNSIVAFELNEDISVRQPQANLAVSEQWASLYTTWNMAFVLSEIDDLDIFFSKLIIPSLLNAEGKDFLGIRFISLWLAINTDVFRTFDHKNVLGPKNKKEMAQAWGEINKKYAFHLAKRETHENSKTLKKHYRRMFSRPIYNLFKLFNAFLR